MIPNGESIKLSELFSSAFAWSILCFKSSRQWQKFIESLLLLKYNWKFDAQSSDIQYIHLFCSSIQLRYIARGSHGKYPYEKFLVRPGIDPVIVSWITIQLWLWSPYYYYNYLYILLNYDSKSLFDPNHKYFYLNLKCTVCIQMQKWVNG